MPGVHAGTTLKYVRGTVRSAFEDAGLERSELLDRGQNLEGGDSHGRFDLDIGVLAVAGPIRLGAVLKNATEPEFEAVRVPRQWRIGAAFDGDRAGWRPLMVAVDADMRRYSTPTGERRVVAAGAEEWFSERRIGVRAGVRVNTVGGEERALTGGVSVAVRSGLYVDAHVVGGGAADERGWGLAARVSF